MGILSIQAPWRAYNRWILFWQGFSSWILVDMRRFCPKIGTQYVTMRSSLMRACHLNILGICTHFNKGSWTILYWLEGKKNDSDVATSVNYGVESLSNWFKFICNPKMGIMRIRGPSTNTTSFEVNTLNGGRQAGWHLSPPRASPWDPKMGGWKYLIHLGIPTMIGWIINGQVHRKIKW